MAVTNIEMIIEDLKTVFDRLKTEKVSSQLFGTINGESANSTYVVPAFDSFEKVVINYAPSKEVFFIYIVFKTILSVNDLTELFDSLEVKYNSRHGGTDFIYSFDSPESKIKSAKSGKLGEYLLDDGQWKEVKNDKQEIDIDPPNVKSIKLYF